MKYKLFISIIVWSILNSNLVAQNIDTANSNRNEIRLAFYPGGYTYISKDSPKNQYWADMYYNSLYPNRNNTLNLELLYKHKSNYLAFVRMNLITYNLDQTNDFEINEQIETNEDSKITNNGNVLINNSRINGGSRMSNGIEFGIGRQFSLNKFKFEPFVSFAINDVAPYEMTVYYKKTDKNIFTTESITPVHRYRKSLGIGTKINYQFKHWGLSFEYQYSTIFLPISYKYFTENNLNESKNESVNTEYKCFSNKFNFGFYIFIKA